MPCGLNKSPLKGTRDVMKLYFKRTTVCALILFIAGFTKFLRTL